ncbi:peptide/nickel transport system ATP-binding protein [Rhodococcus sp. SMB37]|uniref:ABC transporter ATP-binding protein n=1 Tax=Rhodococcus sp. SMB37 TaxID=2512213 RepID=UPI00104A6D7E|nr:ATP-binding cassette domain-containing protein [Rhodococcus sp. SMB37]TCN50887.1 peptide/nickel transport system ATP-binding protein [Rhodococcus sp. SMB37]
MTTPSTLRVRGLTVTDDRGNHPLHQFDFDAATGEIVALVGPSGSGKTTAIAAILGVLPRGVAVTAGSVVWCGPGEHGTRSWRGTTVGYAAQDPASALHPGHTACRSVAEAARMRGCARHDATAAARSVLSELGLTDEQIDSPPHRLSGGQAQRVAVARALVVSPPLVILDEPTSGLDDVTLEPVLAAIIARRRANGVTIVATHDPRLIAVCDRVLRTAPAVDDHTVFVSGRVVRSGTSALELTDFGIRTEQGRMLLDSSTLDVRTGEFVVLRGPSGCGKTTLLRAVCGLHPFDGTLTLDGHAVAARVGERTPQSRAAIALVGQNPRDALNPAHNIERILRRQMRRLHPRADLRAEAERLLDRVAVPRTVLRRRPHELSGGQRQRVAIARALAGRPRLLIADEMTASLDHNTAMLITDLLDELRHACTETDSGLSILATTHDEYLAARADRVVEIHKASIIETPSHTRSTHI